ncbi:MAG TPA: cytochrome c [Xanthobacteraceae bacterium]|nr:cytochrome c [Xanthobacteraceae bacterium]
MGRERRPPLIRLLIALVVLGAVTFLAVLSYALWPTQTRTIALRPAGEDKDLIKKGRYLALAGDCSACHTAPGSKSFAGGLPLASPIGAIYSTNITPDRQAGIGSYSLDQFDRAVRYGIRADGASLYPAMPYPSYARLTDDDVRALYAYFELGVTAVTQENRPTGIPWPLSMRWPLAFWRKTFAPNPDSVAFDPKRYPNGVIARGAYLVQGAGHCGSCHTPRAITLQEQALDDTRAQYLAGGQVIDGWSAISLRGDAGGLGHWSEQDIIEGLKTGRNSRAAVIGNAMGDVVVHSTQYMTDADLRAIAAYLKTLPPSAADGSRFSDNDATARALQAGLNDSRGAEIYVDNCSGCHRTDAQGYPRVFPAIAGNPIVLAPASDSLVRLILAGSRMPVTATAPSALGMPGFGWRLNDDEVAQLATYLRSQWGNAAPPVMVETVVQIRAELSRESEKAAHDQ